MIKAILFDFWGTLVENGTYSPLRQSYEILRARMRFGDFVAIFEDVLMTKSYPDQTAAFTEVLKVFKVPIKQLIIDKLIAVWNKNIILAKPYEETIEVLQKLKEKEFKLAIVSNTPSFSIEQVLDKYDMKQYFDGFFLSYKLGVLKTNVGMFSTAIQTLNVSKEEVIMVGDSLETDIAGAQKAGIRAVLIDRKNKREFPDKIVTLSELENFK
ncbi:HAD family hydrolase [Candidatus Woesearchaeota archaeon]|nr:HAD family hydrolase [Candidatus Woesearchaeota archaeon]